MKLTDFSSVDVDRILGLSDQFLEDWEEKGNSDPDCVERRQEYDTLRPLLVAAPALLKALQKAYPGTELLPDGAFRILKTFDTRRDWICMIQQCPDGSWLVEHNDSRDTNQCIDFAEAMEVAQSFVPEVEQYVERQSA